jgi:methylmalonic aciduria homocystinuria type C protein
MSSAWATHTDEVRAALEANGLDVVAPLRLRWYNDVAPASALIQPTADGAGDDALAILVGNSRALWPAFTAAHNSDPAIGDADDPVDTYVARSITAAIASTTASTSTEPRVFHSNDTTPGKLVAIQRMAHVAGVAHLDEKCHLAIHPVYGPWIALRAVLVFDDIPGPEDAQRVPVPSNPLSSDEEARDRVDSAFAHALQGYADPDASAERWQRWVAVRDAVSSAPHPERYHDDQVLYHYNCQTNGNERERIRDGLRAYRRRTEETEYY